MKYLTSLLSMVLLAGCTASADLIPKQYYTNDVSKPTTSKTLTFRQGSSQSLSWTYKQGSAAKDLTGATLVVFKYVPYDKAWSQVVTGALDVATNGSVVVNFTPAQLNTNSGSRLFDFLLEVSNGTDILGYTMGKLNLLADPTSGITNAFPTTTQTIDWSDYAAYENTASHGPVRPGTGITTVTNADGSITISASTAGVTDHSLLSNLAWTQSGHTGTPARLAGFFEGGAAGYSSPGAGLYFDGEDNLAVSNEIVLGTAGSNGAVAWVVLQGYGTGNLSKTTADVTYAPISVVDTTFTNYLAGDTEIVVAGDARSGSNNLSIGSTITRDTELAAYLPLAGGTMVGELAMGGSDITGLSYLRSSTGDYIWSDVMGGGWQARSTSQTGTVAVVVIGTTFPTHAAGRLYYHSTSNKLFCSDGSAWNALW